MSSQPNEAAAAAAASASAAADMFRLKAAVQDLSIHQNARTRPDVSRVSREELEDRFLRLYEESLLFKQHIQTQEDKIKQLGTKLVKLVKDRGRMEQLAAGGVQPVSSARNVEMEMMVEELQEKVRGLQTEKEGLRQRLLVAKQQLMNSQSGKPRPYKHVPPRVNSGLKRRDESPPPAQPRVGLLEDARSRTRNLENVVESQRRHMEEMEVEVEQLREELQNKEVEYEERMVQAQQINKLRSHVNSNVTQIKLQKQLTDKSRAVTELETQLQEHKQTLKAAVQKMDELSEQLKQEQLKSRDVENQLHISNNKLEQLPQQLSEVEQERDQLKESYNKLLDSIFDTSPQQKWQIQEQQLKQQIVQLETALKADLGDKNQILQKLKAERENHEKLTEENKRLQIQLLQQKRETDDLKDRLIVSSADGERPKQKQELSFLEQVEERGLSVQELQAAHAETILELEKTRHLLSTESKISNDYKAELEATQQKIDGDRANYEQQLQRQIQLLHNSNAKIHKLQAQLKEHTYKPRTPGVFRPDVTDEAEDDQLEETVLLERGEALLELQMVRALLSPSLLESLGDREPYTFCTYSFYTFQCHSTPVVTGHRPQYGYTSRYVAAMDSHFLDYVSRSSVTVELHQALGTDWRTLGSGQVHLQQLLEQDGKVHGTIQLIGAEFGSVGSLDYWMKLTTEEKLNASDVISPALKPSADIISATATPDDVTSSALNIGDVASFAVTSDDVISSAPKAESRAPFPVPKPRRETPVKDASVAKKVTFVNPTSEEQVAEETSLRETQATSSSVTKVVTPAPVRTGEEEEEESLFSVGQLLQGTSHSDSDISEEIVEEVEEVKPDQSESAQSDSDDCIVHGPTSGRKPSERVLLEVVALTLRPESRVARDASVVRLFVEYSFLDLPTEETPLSLPKPSHGRSINFNYSKVIPVDAENNAARRRLLKTVLQGRRPHMEKIKFTVVSEPPEEEEQDRECEDVGVAFLRIPEILDKQQDLNETSLNVVDVQDQSEVVGSLTVSVEALEALQDIMEDQDPVSFLLPST